VLNHPQVSSTGVLTTAPRPSRLAYGVRTTGLRLFDLAGEFGVFATVEH